MLFWGFGPLLRVPHPQTLAAAAAARNKQKNLLEAMHETVTVTV
jgi:hypothetical protein